MSAAAADPAREALSVLLGPAADRRPADALPSRAALDARLASDPGDPHARLLSAIARLTMGDPAGARADLAAARTGADLDPALVAVSALARAQSGDEAGGIALLDAALSKRPAGWLHALRGTLRLGRGDLPGAREDLDSAVTAEPSAWVLAQRADVLNRMGFYRDALADLVKVQALIPDGAAPLLTAANIYFDQAFYLEAMEMMDRARALAPADAALLARRARFLHLLGRLPEAENELTRARALAPDDSQIRYELLLVRVLLGRGKEVAAEILKKPVAPPYNSVLFAYLEFRAGRRRKAAGLFRRAAAASGGAFAERMTLYAFCADILGDRRGPPRAGKDRVEFFMCGIGIKHPFQATVEILRALDRCAVIYNNLGDPQIADFLGLFSAEIRAVDRRAGEPAMGRVDRILSGVRRRGLPTGFVTRIHPFIYRRIANDLAQRCEDMGLRYRAFASVSLTESAWGLGEAAGGPPPAGTAFGGRVFDLVWLVAHPELLEPRHALVVYCIAGSEDRARFAGKIAALYPAEHRAFVLAGSGDNEQRVREVRVGDLSRDLPGFDMGAVLYVPPTGENA